VQCAEHFEHAIKSAIMDRLVPGIGQAWVRFDMVDGQETIFIDTVFWEDFIYEPARSWEQVTWCGRRIEVSKEEAIERWGEEKAGQLESAKSNDTATPKEINSDKYTAYEIWDKKTRKMCHVAKGLEEPLDEKDDPYGLMGFFPCPRPLIANPVTASFLPVTDYHQAQDQYNQLDVLYARISLIIEAVKVAGCYDASETAIGTMLTGEENKLIPVDGWAMYMEKGGAKGMIDWFPIEQVVSVLQSLQAQFEAVKAVLYEVSGMSDIMRGASNQYETASAQEIKAQFASVRMNGYQRDVSEFVGQVLNIMAGIICNLYSDQKIMAIVGTLTEPDMALLPQAAGVIRDNFQRMYKVSIEPDSLTQADWALEKGQRMELVGYISQLLNTAIPAAQETPELAPLMLSLIKFSVAGFKGAAEIEGVLDQQLAELTRKAQEGGEKEPSPEQQKMQMEQQKMQMEMQMEMQRFQMEMQLKTKEAEQSAILEAQKSASQVKTEEAQLQADMMVKQAELAHKREMAQIDMQIKLLELEMKQKESQMKLELQAASGQQKIEQASAQAAIKKESQNGKGKD